MSKNEKISKNEKNREKKRLEKYKNRKKKKKVNSAKRPKISPIFSKKGKKEMLCIDNKLYIYILK